jgi:S1-C subfamily serine protease
MVHPDGYVVTNSHVVRGGTRIFVSLAKSMGGRAYEARLLEDDPAHDLALLRIAGHAPFPYVALCRTREVLVGETAIAIGNPYGLGDTVTQGIVSAKGRKATLSTGRTVENLIQTDASINLGNSGGALLNLEGELIGVICSIHPGAQGIAFTVAADDVQAMLDRNLGAKGRPPPPGPTVDLDEIADADCPESPAEQPASDPAPAPRIGTPLAQAAPAPPPVRAPTPAPPAPAPSAAPSRRAPVGLALRPGTGGVLVASVTPGSNADIAGLKVGDLVLDVDGKATTTPSDLAAQFSNAAAGRSFFLNLRRGDRKSNAILVVP